MGGAGVGKKETDRLHLGSESQMNKICYGFKVYLMGARPQAKLFTNS